MPISKEQAREEVKVLVEKYNKIVEDKKVNRYKEEDTKAELIEPLFEALGWDVRNKTHKDEVTREEKISKGRVDYSFRINGIPKFFLEAKALKEDLDNPKFVEQAINYAWHKGCTWAVLTDFESVKIFNAEWKIANPFQSHLKTIPCHEFLDRFNELWLLSKESFEQGLIDKEAEKWGKKTKKTPVDKQLLADFTKFRELLSKSATKLNQNKKLTEEELDESIQRILDRLIFIRNCEDKGLEEKTLLSNLREWASRERGQLVKSLRGIFTYFDQQYNSKIFDKHLCDDLDIDSEVLHEIIEGLYYTKDKSVSYDFSAIEADVLGSIYEQYLGHILKKTEKGAKLKESHAHRKEQGIYYTPTYIVDYIVRNTLGELLKNKKVDAPKIRVLDPACGSGSFLIKAFDILNEYYAKDKEEYRQKTLAGDNVAYSAKERILVNNIFGVDLDKQAVEIAQLNLLLKIAEKGHRLPLLQENIKCGNSLIDDPTVAGDKAFKWEEQFKEIMQEGGFDVVIGNPPWGTQFSYIEKEFLSNNYFINKQNMNSFELFLRKSILILKEGGIIGFLIPRNLIRSGQYADIRKKLLEKFIIHKIIDFKKFPEVTQECVAIIATKLGEKDTEKKNKNLVVVNEGGKIPQGFFLELSNNVFNLDLDEAKFQILNKFTDGLALGDIVDIDRGEEISKKGGVIQCPYCGCWSFASKKEKKRCDKCNREFDVSKVKKDSIIKDQKSESSIPILIGEDFTRYRIIKKHYINKNLKGLKSKSNVIYNSPKLIMMAVSPIFVVAFDENENIIITKNNYSIRIKTDVDIDLKYVIAVLNSKLYQFYQNNNYTLGAEYTIFISQDYLRTVKIMSPIKMSFNQKEIYKKLIKLVDKILLLNKNLNEIGDKKTDERMKIEEEIKKIDKEIDELVYKIYGITEKEKKIIEESLK